MVLEDFPNESYCENVVEDSYFQIDDSGGSPYKRVIKKSGVEHQDKFTSLKREVYKLGDKKDEQIKAHEFALLNLFKKINYLELEQQFSNDQITEKEFENELDSNFSKYSVEIMNREYSISTVQYLRSFVENILPMREFFIEDMHEIWGVSPKKLLEK